VNTPGRVKRAGIALRCRARSASSGKRAQAERAAFRKHSLAERTASGKRGWAERAERETRLVGVREVGAYYGGARGSAEGAGVSGVTDPFTTPGHVSADGHIAYASIQFGIPGSSIPNSEATALMHDATAASGHGMTFSLGGDVVDLAETCCGRGC
jgi:hypothetical protein